MWVRVWVGWGGMGTGIGMGRGNVQEEERRRGAYGARCQYRLKYAYVVDQYGSSAGGCETVHHTLCS